jgi:predicted RND superfamily exporter protein
VQRDFITRSNRVFGAIAGWSFDHRWWVVALALLVLAGSAGLASQATTGNSYEAFFDPRDPAYLSYEQFREDFGSDEISYILYEAPDTADGAFDLEVMRKIAHLTEVLEDEVPFVYEVTSLTNAELMVGVDDGIEIRALADDLPTSQEALRRWRAQYLAKPLLVGGIVSEDGEFGAIVIEMDRSSTDPLEQIRFDPEGGDGLPNLYPQVTDNAIREILARPEYAGIVFHHSGDVPLNAIYNVVIEHESVTLGLATAGVIALLLLFFFRSAVGVLAPTIVVQLSVLASVAFIATVGWELDLSFMGTPTLLTAIGVAHSVHILSEFRARFVELGERREALVQTLSLVGTPCLLTSITTAIGFGSMSFVPIKSIAHMGVYSAFGVLVAFFLSITLLLALLSFGRRTPSRPFTQRQRLHAKGGRGIHNVLTWVAGFAIRRRVAILGVFAGIFAASLLGIARLTVDSNWLDDFSDDMPLKQATLRVDEVMGGIANLILLFDGGTPESVKEPAVLAEIARVQAWANEREFVRKTYSIVDILADLNQTFHDDDPAFHRVPETRELVAQYLLLYESAGGTEADEYVSSDFRRARLELRLPVALTSEMAELVASLEAELSERPLQATTVSMTGIGALWLKLLDYIVSSQIQGFLLAFGLIGVLMCVLLRSFVTGVISMLPNLSPILLTLGVMGWLGIFLDYSKATIAAVALGIAVDDTIHLISRYRHEFHLCGSYSEALRAALSDVGRALMITSIALVAGFLVLLASVLDMQATQGLLLATTIVTALVADFLLMPALVLTFKPFGPEGSRVATRAEETREAT